MTTTPEPTDPAGVSEKLDRIADEAMMDRYGMTNRDGSDWGWARRTAEIAIRTPDPVLEVANTLAEVRFALGDVRRDVAARVQTARDLIDAALQTINERGKST